MRASLLLLRLLPLVALPSCLSVSSSSSSSPVLLTEAQGPGAYSSETALVGTPFPVTVRALSLPFGDCGAGPCPGGIDALTAVSAACDANACTAVVNTASTDVPTFLVTPTVAGPTVLRVRVRGSSGGDYADTLAMTFVDAAHIEVHEDPILNRVKYASLPGNQVNWQITLESDGGTRLAADPSRVQATVDGAAYALGTNSMDDPSYLTLRAVQPGTATVRVSLGASARSLSLSVVDVSDVTGVEVHAIPTPTVDQRLAETLEGPDVFSAAAVTSVTESLLQGGSTWALVLHTKSGAPAMGGASRLGLAPQDLGSIVTSEDGVFTLQSDRTSAATGKLTGTIGGAVVSLPVVLTD